MLLKFDYLKSEDVGHLTYFASVLHRLKIRLGFEIMAYMCSMMSFLFKYFICQLCFSHTQSQNARHLTVSKVFHLIKKMCKYGIA